MRAFLCMSEMAELAGLERLRECGVHSAHSNFLWQFLAVRPQQEA